MCVCVYVVGGGARYLFISKLIQVNMALCAMSMLLLKEGKCDFLHKLIIQQVPRHTAKIIRYYACFLL